jgi:hypothetical protein
MVMITSCIPVGTMNEGRTSEKKLYPANVGFIGTVNLLYRCT